MTRPAKLSTPMRFDVNLVELHTLLRSVKIVLANLAELDTFEEDMKSGILLSHEELIDFRDKMQDLFNAATCQCDMCS